jgi:hypothetical protein
LYKLRCPPARRARPPPGAIAFPDGSAPPSNDEHARLNASKIYPFATQLNHTLSEIIASLDRTRLWTISCIRPNDSDFPNSFDKRRVRAQVRSMLIRDFVARRSVECITDFEQGEFFERYVPTMRGSEMEWIRQTSHMRRPWATEDTLTRAGIICHLMAFTGTSKIRAMSSCFKSACTCPGSQTAIAPMPFPQRCVDAISEHRGWIHDSCIGHQC